jgi:hypothetical protein
MSRFRKLYMKEVSKKKNTPKVISANHISWHRSPSRAEVDHTWNRLEKLVEAAEREKKSRTLFVEGEKIDFEYARHPMPSRLVHDPFYRIINRVKVLGWKVVYLDENNKYERICDELKIDHPEIITYFGKDLREAHWAEVLHHSKVTSDDFVLVHSNHVRGFIRRAGFQAGHVVWVDLPKTDPLSPTITPNKKRRLRKLVEERIDWKPSFHIVQRRSPRK